MILKKNISNVTEKIIKANYYNFQTRDFVLNIYSRLLQIYYEYIEISLDKLSTLEIQQNVISNYSYFLKENYHNFTVFYYDYNLAIKLFIIFILLIYFITILNFLMIAITFYFSMKKIILLKNQNLHSSNYYFIYA
jgi:hypothetical protein